MVIDYFTKIQATKNTKLVLYEGPKTIKPSNDTKIKVNGHDVFVYDATVNNTHRWVNDGKPPLSKTPMTYFDFEGKVNVEITVSNINKIESCSVLPTASGIKPLIKGNTVTFRIDNPGFYTVQFNNSVEGAVHIFANPIEKDIPKKGDKNVVFIGPGEWTIDDIALESGQTLYISGGAVVHTTVHGTLLNNVTIRGRGIVDGSIWDSWTQKGEIARVPINVMNSKNVNIEGIILLNPNAWALNLFECDDVKVDNVKIITARPNGDGITIQSSRDIYVSNSFVRSWDDSLVVKNYAGNSNNITFDNIQVWTDLAQSCEIGYETNKGKQPNSTISNITFKNITVLYNFHKPVISIHNSDDALVENITYQNIVVENAQMGSGDAGDNNQLIDFAILPSQWSSTHERGNIRAVTVENVKVLRGNFPPSRIVGYDENHTIENVKIKNLLILGKKINSLDEGKFKTNQFAKNISIE
ncbi:MAG TPA: hypothetical protein GXX15_01250 [Clostridia bacterium]|nr:hypothetical protein [Clostridia bacterium]